MPTDNKPPGGSASSSNEFSKLHLKLPPFWPTDPELWFAQVDNQFLTASITDDTIRYGYVAGHLEARYAAEVRDILTSPPAKDKYNKLKEELIRRLSITQEQKTRQLLEDEKIGDRKPSQFLRHLQSLAGTAVPEELLRSLWTSRLPSNIQAILATQAKASLEVVVELADTIMATTTSQINAVNRNPLEDTIKLLIQEIQQLKSQSHWRSRSRERSQSRGYSQPRNYKRFPSNQRNFHKRPADTCYYHWKFQDKAFKCSPGCKNWADRKQENDNGRRSQRQPAVTNNPAASS